MVGKYNNNEFEQFLKENADKHRLYPSEKSWDIIHTRLHTKKRWRAIAILLLFLSAGSVTAVTFSNEETGNKNIAQVKNNTKRAQSAIKTANQAKNNSSTDLSGNIFGSVNSNSVALSTENSTSLPIRSITENTIEAEKRSLTKNPNEFNAQANSLTPNPAPAERQTLANVRSKAPVSPKEKLSITVNSQTPVIAKIKSHKGFNWQIHFTPTVSYRSLKEDAKFIESARTSMSMSVPAFATNSDIKNVVKHKPDLGIQFGLTGRTAISKRMFFTAGLQFNVSKYDIKAYSYPSEVATIAYSNAYGYPSSISTVTNYRINGGLNSANWLRNYYFSAAAPVGLEWRIAGTKNNYWGISGTVQPTYVLGNRAYVISTDYQNYAEVPYLTRKWNLNFGFETFAKVKIGNANLRVGPQFRYQAFSSFKKIYPVQEHLFDFGVKMGLILGK